MTSAASPTRATDRSGVKKSPNVLIYVSHAEECPKFWGIAKSRLGSELDHKRINQQRERLLSLSSFDVFCFGVK